MIKESAESILRLLAEGGAYNFHELAAKTGLSVPAIKKTVEELEREYGLLSVQSTKGGHKKVVKINMIPPTKYLLNFLEWYHPKVPELPEAYRIGIVALKNEACSAFGKTLFSLVLFGSLAKGLARHSERKRSDIDVLIVLSKMDERAERAVEERVMRKTGMATHITCFTPATLLENVRTLSPLLLELYRTHCVLYDRKGIFRSALEDMTKYIKYRKARYDEARKHWVIGSEA